VCRQVLNTFPPDSSQSKKPQLCLRLFRLHSQLKLLKCCVSSTKSLGTANAGHSTSNLIVPCYKQRLNGQH
jgi:hypothetical protein